ncbi:oligosaccharide flippase family protein [uncultured Bacteroides sp.]|uniref:oligosaccharide flippase family protein n=1 Tax=uncultured Bacteroides sp. TaxID=162156 RepID=UPI002621971B|nr:oligosaccharide flippase family protein [uncultured Bacteroides sp.]
MSFSSLNKILSIWNNRSEAAKSAIVFTFAVLLSRGIAIISLPVFTRIMPPEQIGIVGLYVSTFGIISTISALALTSGGFMVGLKDFFTQRDAYVSSVATLTTITSIILFLLFIIAPSFWAETTGLSVGLILLMLFGCMVCPAYEFWLMRQRYEYAYKKAAILTVFTSVISTLLAVGAVLLAKDNSSCLGEVRLYVAFGFTYIVYFIILIVLLSKGNRQTYFNKQYWNFSLTLSLPLLGHSFASQILSVSDRLLISNLIDNSAVGIYSTLYSVGFIAMMFWGALNSSFIPYLFQKIEIQDDREKVASNAQMLLLGFSTLILFVALMVPDIVSILATDEYYKYVSIVPPIIAGTYLIAFGNFYTNLLVYCKKTQAIMLSTIVAGGVSVLLNLFLIPIFGFTAAAYTALLAYILLAFMQSVLGYRFFKKNIQGPFIYNNRKMAAIAFITVLLTLCSVITYPCNVLRYALIFVLVPLMIKGYFLCKRR